MVAAAVMIGVAVWEWPNLRRWGARGRAAFGVSWFLMLVWVVLAQLHVHLPNPIKLINTLAKPLAHRWLVPTPDRYW